MLFDGGSKGLTLDRSALNLKVVEVTNGDWQAADVIVHPATGKKIWFNQAHLFHVSSLEQKIQDQLLSVLTEAELPRNTYYGDGAPIEAETLRVIRDVYARNTISFDWQRNDLLLIDNMLFSHGRTPYSGNRQVLVGMARPIDAEQVETRP